MKQKCLEKRKEVFKKYKGHCAYCGIKLDFLKFQVDHIIPLYRKSSQSELERAKIERGKNSIENYNPSCGSCNSSKSTFSIEQWRHQLEHKVTAIRRDTSNFRILERFGLVKVIKSKVIFYFEKGGKNG